MGITVLPKMATTPVAPERPARRLSRKGMGLFIVAVVAVVIATVVGVRGLLASPVVSVGSDGVATLQGTWEPYSCDAHLCQGYLQAGSRSVFVVFPAGCPQPQRAADLIVTARPDPGLGVGSYAVIGCAR
jgi:hypothetical protein